ncbi:MAG: TIGR03088 family PEP-CTERM/XrtA system glycosyltransferase [Methylococcaceae bacterium]|nr:TIGR03088 family PEP-CTERM/XrtA system glycosyltransferase [Methylococcaceae bacterium]MDZ4155898.1 TIGR03088 family PEP-CTERM/XrtA system glycosyltransferase [Methylococcales bacterium]MDP2392275.1 TIGR03088 family PEP-CTERM/XrtA system glycosyltransferase [Methylococcaceae bacterium]MDP3019008.1 TIGR03088 family PEP-CTERM/XrtA system glycosyltransferase [Methylococcaceae bacterium]MDP3391569.1 TIGR03088 family PEP-CTERM/XrtA system glycosyltransferase [Methylococcaceae bacterium]
MNAGKPLIAHVLFRLGTGGLENGVVNLINHLPDDKYRHAVICMTNYTDFRKRITNKDVQVYCLNKKPGKDFAVYLRLWRLLRTIKPDILHTRNLSALEAQLSGLLAGVKHRIHGEHGRDIDDVNGTNPRYVFLRKLFRPLVHRYIPMSKDLENWLVRQIQVPPQKITQLYNGVDLSRFKVGNEKPLELLPPSFRTPGLQIIGTVGRLDPVKDQITLVAALIHLLSTSPELKDKVRLVLVGAGGLQERLNSMIQVADLNDLVWFAGDRSDVADLMRTLDIFVLPSINEGISNTILEAMATGLPVIATKVGGNPELVVDNETGILIPKQNPVAMSDAIKLYLDNPELITAHGQAGRHHCESVFSLSRMVSDYARAYDSLIKLRK